MENELDQGEHDDRPDVKVARDAYTTPEAYRYAKAEEAKDAHDQRGEKSDLKKGVLDGATSLFEYRRRVRRAPA